MNVDTIDEPMGVSYLTALPLRLKRIESKLDKILRALVGDKEAGTTLPTTEEIRHFEEATEKYVLTDETNEQIP